MLSGEVEADAGEIARPNDLTVLRGLGFEAADFGKPTETFSSGWQMRIALAKLLLRRPRLTRSRSKFRRTTLGVTGLTFDQRRAFSRASAGSPGVVRGGRR